MPPAPSTAGVCLTEVRRLGALCELEKEWASLFDEARGVTPFLHPAWLLSWCEAFGVERVCAAVVRDASNGRLLAVLPCHDPEGGSEPLSLLGGDLSDHRGPVIRAGDEAAGPTLFAWMESRHSRGVLDDLPCDHPWATAALPEG